MNTNESEKELAYAMDWAFKVIETTSPNGLDPEKYTEEEREQNHVTHLKARQKYNRLKDAYTNVYLGQLEIDNKKFDDAIQDLDNYGENNGTIITNLNTANEVLGILAKLIGVLIEIGIL